MVTEKNAELQKRFNGLWIRIGAKGDPAPIYKKLETAYSTLGRAYHNLSHLSACFTEFDMVRENKMLERPNTIEFALWYHDFVYDPRSKLNEEKSAREGKKAAAESFGDVALNRVYELIMDTKHITIPTTNDGKYMVDIDLAASLGQPRAVYDEYARCIRAEYSWVPENTYKVERSKILYGFLRRKTIFATQFFEVRYGLRADDNIRREIQSLST